MKSGHRKESNCSYINIHSIILMYNLQIKKVGRKKRLKHSLTFIGNIKV